MYFIPYRGLKARGSQTYIMENGSIILLKFTIAGFSATTLVLIFLYKRYRITQRMIIEKNEMLLSSEQLLKETHHRVKNNLHSVICLLESQAKGLKEDACLAIQSSTHRIYAMLLIHQKLYLSKDVKTIDMETYIKELIIYLDRSIGMTGNLHFEVEITPLQLCPPRAIPIALIINEAVTNAIRHAFPENVHGTILIRITQKDGYIFIRIQDNGIGLNAKQSGKEGSFGLKLMNGLTADIDGEISFENRKGTLITLKIATDDLRQTNKELLSKEYCKL
jgi:two-component system, sensor histidine kinase PdtaS